MGARADRPVAAIDLGTNTALLLVARRSADGRLDVLDDRSETARLGEGLARTGRLADAATERTLAVLGRYVRRAAELGVAPSERRAVGTAVLRRAADAGRFVELARERLDLAVEVIGEEEEARLGYAAVVAESGAARATVDVGGGSTEWTAAGGTDRRSVPIGAVVLTERFLGAAGAPPVEDGGWSALSSAVRDACTAFPAGTAEGGEVVLLGGSAANLASLVRGGERFDHETVEGTVLGAGAAERWAERLVALPVDARRALPIEADRAGILPAGLACLAGALARLGAATARVTTRGLRYGVARELLARIA